MEHKNMQLFGNGVKRTYGTEAEEIQSVSCKIDC